MVNWLPTLLMLLAVGDTGAAVPAVAVVMFAMVPVMFVSAKLNVPVPPKVIFCTFIVERVLVNTQVRSAPATMLAAGTVATLPENEPNVPVLPVTAPLASVQLKPVKA